MAQLAGGEPDPVLVQQLRGGSESALTSLFERHADAIYTYCFRRTASWHSAEDATSTVFLEAWRSRVRVEAFDGSALPWLYGIANNVCRNAARSLHRRVRAVQRLQVDSSIPDHAEGVVQRVDATRRMAGVLAEISKLPRHEQDVLALVVWSELSYEQTAAALRIPLGTVRSRLSRARRRLATTLDADPTHPIRNAEDDHA